MPFHYNINITNHSSIYNNIINRIENRTNQSLNIVYNKKEKDWIATYHACAVAKNNNSLFFLLKKLVNIIILLILNNLI